MTKECTVMIKFLFLKGKRAKEIYDDISLRLGEKSSSNSTVKNWVAWCNTEHFSTEGKDHPRKATSGHCPEKWMPFTAWSWKIGEFQPER